MAHYKKVPLLFLLLTAVCSALELGRLNRRQLIDDYAGDRRFRRQIVGEETLRRNRREAEEEDAPRRSSFVFDKERDGVNVHSGFYPETHNFRTHRKRDTGLTDEERASLDSILKDDDEPEIIPKKHTKTKRQSNEEVPKEEKNEETKPHKNEFQDWLRKEYYRYMAQSLATMRRKRSSHKNPTPRKKKSVSFEEVTDNLRAIEDVLFLDALEAIKEEDGGSERVVNDLSSAYDLETMRKALYRLRDTLGKEQAPTKRGEQCPALDMLTSDCSSIGDIVSDGPLKRLLIHACNWHEVCYTCGEAYGLTSETCDVGFIEQSQTICRGDIPCESTASLLLLPLRERRVFYKRSNPSVCLIDPCVEEFLKGQ